MSGTDLFIRLGALEPTRGIPIVCDVATPSPPPGPALFFHPLEETPSVAGDDERDERHPDLERSRT